jgi:hypothetical protein
MTSRKEATLWAGVASLLFASAAQAGPLAVRSEDGSHEVRITVQTQLRLEATAPADDPSARPDLSFKLHRLWPGFTANLFDNALRVRGQFNTTPGNFELLDLWVDSALPLPPLAGTDLGLRLRGGVFIGPWLWWRELGWRNLIGSDWGYVIDEHGGERQWGLNLYRRASEALPVEAHLSVTTGKHWRFRHAGQMPKGVYLLDVPKPSNLFDPTFPTEVHPEIISRVDWVFGPADAPQNLSDTDGRPRGRVAVSAGFDLRPERGVDMPQRAALEGLVQGFGFSVHGALMAHTFTDGGDAFATGLGSVGATGGVSWRVLKKLELTGRGSWTAFTEEIRDDARAYANTRVREADEDERDELIDRLAGAGALEGAGDAAVGVSFHLFEGTRLMFEGAWLPKKERTRGFSATTRARAQIHVAF